MAPPDPRASEYLQELHAHVTLLLAREIQRKWDTGALPRIHDEFSGSFVSSDEVSAILRRGLSMDAVPAAQAAPAAATPDLQKLDRRVTEHHAARARWGAAPGDDRAPPIPALAHALALGETEQLALEVLLALELWSDLRTLARYYVNEPGRAHADIGLIEDLVYSTPAHRKPKLVEVLPGSPLCTHRLVEGVFSRAAASPLCHRPLRLHPRIVEWAHGARRLDPEVAAFAELERPQQPPGPLLVAEGLPGRVAALLSEGRSQANAPAADASGPPKVVMLAGPEGAGRKSLVVAAALSSGRPVLTLDGAELARTPPSSLEPSLRAALREARLFDAVVLIEDIHLLRPASADPVHDRQAALARALVDYPHPIAATCPPSDTRPVAIGRTLVMIDVGLPNERQRAELWRTALGENTSASVDPTELGERYPITGGTLLRAAAAATAHARARAQGQDMTGEVTISDIHLGLRGTLEHKLAGLGRRIDHRQRWNDLILPTDELDEIHQLIARLAHRRKVYDQWGFADKFKRGLGISALFSGEPGTGKTMVAGLIAEELALDLYQVDLSRIVSKYIGETERNLAELFAAAEAGHAIILFDEADSLFAKRTEVKTSVDRYANLEVNYLLQRMESFGGITLLTTNKDAAIDEAFKRRITYRVNFPFPEPDDRRRLWQVMLPDAAEVAGDIDFDLLAARYEMSGGYIRNAVLRAAFLAAAAGTAIDMHHLQRAANLEYTAMGKVISHHIAP